MFWGLFFPRLFFSEKETGILHRTKSKLRSFSVIDGPAVLLFALSLHLTLIFIVGPYP